MDAMSDAIDNADLMLYGVSLAYKESANCRLEASLDLSRLVVHSSTLTCPCSVGQLRPSARARHDPADDAERLCSEGLA